MTDVGVHSSAELIGHTPGPWVADQRPHFGEWFVRQDPENWNGMGYQHICSLPADRKGTHYGDMFAANARLIAAAPDLLEAAQNLTVWMGVMETLHGELKGGPAQALNEARAALAKATEPVARASNTPSNTAGDEEKEGER